MYLLTEKNSKLLLNTIDTDTVVKVVTTMKDRISFARPAGIHIFIHFSPEYPLQ